MADSIEDHANHDHLADTPNPGPAEARGLNALIIGGRTFAYAAGLSEPRQLRPPTVQRMGTGGDGSCMYRRMIEPAKARTKARRIPFSAGTRRGPPRAVRVFTTAVVDAAKSHLHSK